MYKVFFKSLAIFSSLFIVIVSCNTNDPFEITPPDFDSVPPATSIAGIAPVQIEEGVTAYIHDEGSGEFFVTVRDQVQA
ncbi:MAG: hypothetical protein WD607_04705, partial [Candidatus Paceibacterota bacterium]